MLSKMYPLQTDQTLKIVQYHDNNQVEYQDRAHHRLRGSPILKLSLEKYCNKTRRSNNIMTED